MPDRSSPPHLAASFLAWRLPPEVREAILGDLEHEYRQRLAGPRGRLTANVWYWVQAITVRAGALRRAARRVERVRPSYQRMRPGCAVGGGLDRWRATALHFGDLRYATRRLLRGPGFTTVAILSLALGIGANTAMFSLVNAVLLRRLPVTHPEELVEVYTSEQDGFEYATSSQPDYRDLREESDIFESTVGTRTFITRLDIDGVPRVTFGELISWDYFQTLGVPMVLGRPFVEEEDATPGTHPVTILGHRTWERDFASAPDVVGTSVYLNGRAYTIVGVAPKSFSGSMPVLVTGFYVPLMMTDEIMGVDQLSRRGSRSMFLKARLRPGSSVEQANAALRAFSSGLEERYPETNENRVMSALPASDVALHPLVDRVLTPVAALLLAVVGVVLLIACTNLASFLLARAQERRKEVAVRLALGAGRWALVRQLLVESSLLALLGGAVGILLARWSLGLLRSFQPPLPIPVDFAIPIDRTVLLFTAGVSLLAGLAFGLIPALQATNPDVAPTLKNEGTGGGSPRRVDVRGMLVVSQVALSFVLLIGAGLFVRSLQKAQTIDPGFDTGAAALLWPMPEISGYESEEAVRDFYDRFEARLRAHPAVTSVALADRLPLGAGVQTSGYLVPGVPSDTPDGDHDIDNAHVNPGYFEAMGVGIVAGRSFRPEDREGERVTVVSRAFVDRFYPGEDVVGRVIQDGAGGDLRIVGVAADTKVRTLGETARPYVYELQGQTVFFGMQVVVRGSGTSEELVAAARAVLDETDPDMVLLEEPKTMNDHLALLLFPPRMAALLLSVFGGLALLLAAVGIYGVVSCAVTRRTRELGIRMSLGASSGDVVRMGVGWAMRLVAVGGAAGVLLAGAVMWAISGFLYGIGPNDVATFVAIPVLLSAVALFAAWVPARRASSVDPIRALRSE